MCSIDDEKHFKEILGLLNKKDSELFKLGYNFSKKAHEWQKRKSWEPYFIHPLSVALSLWDRFWNIDLAVAGFLHDTVEDCEKVNIWDIYKKFWKNIWFMVDSITKWENTFFWESEQILDIKDKMIAWGMRNIWCILLKLADREHNLETLHHMPAHKQVKKSFESQSLYIPLMHILWFNEKKSLDISKCDKLFKKYLNKNNLTGYKQIKNHLLNICFKDFNEELFDIVYKNTKIVVWEIEDKEFFYELVENWWFDGEGIKIQSIELSSKGDFKAIFNYTNWVIINNMSWKLNISKENFIW